MVCIFSLSSHFFTDKIVRMHALTCSEVAAVFHRNAWQLWRIVVFAYYHLQPISLNTRCLPPKIVKSLMLLLDRSFVEKHGPSSVSVTFGRVEW